MIGADGFPFAAARRAFAARPVRERVLVGVAAAAGVFAVGFWGAWLPLTADVERLRAAAPQARAALAEGRRMAEAIPALERSARAAPAGALRAEVERALAAHAGAPAGATLEAQGDRLRLNFAAVPFDRLVALLEALQRDARLQVVEAQLAARVEPGVVRAELLVGR